MFCFYYNSAVPLQSNPLSDKIITNKFCNCVLQETSEILKCKLTSRKSVSIVFFYLEIYKHSILNELPKAIK